MIEEIRKEILRRKGLLVRGACSAQIQMETACKDEAYDEVLAILDTIESRRSGKTDDHFYSTAKMVGHTKICPPKKSIVIK